MLYRVINLLFDIIRYAIIAEAILSFLPMGTLREIRSFLNAFTEPILSPFRRIQERFSSGMMIDFSPLLALLALSFLEGLIFQLL
ncbi:YggT family protein [Alloiococcus sp. CFN-8]|uniref:YggT family protein n=1 Tax=Alloiococcus sp. CFN-8 TaxID=3416081 RepID=UPI003CF57B55